MALRAWAKGCTITNWRYGLQAQMPLFPWGASHWPVAQWGTQNKAPITLVF